MNLRGFHASGLTLFAPIAAAFRVTGCGSSPESVAVKFSVEWELPGVVEAPLFSGKDPVIRASIPGRAGAIRLMHDPTWRDDRGAEGGQ